VGYVSDAALLKHPNDELFCLITFFPEKKKAKTNNCDAFAATPKMQDTAGKVCGLRMGK